MKIDNNIPIMDYVDLYTIMELNILDIDKNDYFGNGWVIIHLTANVDIKGFHYVESDHVGNNYLDYIAENDISENDKIYYGMVDGYILKVIQLLK